MQEARRRIRLSWMALAFFLACLAVLHILNWDNLPRHMSEFVRARGSILWGAGLLALAAGLIGLGFSLPQVLPTDKDARLACRLLVAAGLVTLLLVVFPTDVTPQPSTFPGYMHDIGALSALCL